VEVRLHVVPTHNKDALIGWLNDPDK
ncbi:hypothetical protein LCGC14_3020170, partial [marine sediment metagenome]